MEKITTKILHIPPFISTAWKNIETIELKNIDTNPLLTIHLKNGSRIEVPNLPQERIHAIFDAHEKFLEQEISQPKEKQALLDTTNFGFSLPMGGGLETLGATFQHNPAQANAPEIPKEIVSKIAAISKVLGLENPELLPKPQPSCNCMYCQVARALLGEDNALEETITDEDLRFRSWDIEQTGPNLYHIKNPLDDKEHYNVYLGDPVGCTCGEKNCEHIKAVLNS
ncbi:MAG: hypothetical protein WCP39_03420 [Chlamydiota bacterium]